MDTRESFEKSKKQIRGAREEIQNGIFCECGGLMKETGGVYLCDVKGKFVDKYALQCEKCGKKDFFVVEVKHLNRHALSKGS